MNKNLQRTNKNCVKMILHTNSDMAHVYSQNYLKGQLYINVNKGQLYITVNKGHLYITVNKGQLYITVSKGHLYITVNKEHFHFLQLMNLINAYTVDSRCLELS